MKKDIYEKKKRRTITIVLLTVVVSSLLILGIWTYFGAQEQSEACRKWEELKEYNDQRKSSDSQLQQGVSVTQTQEIKYREMCESE